MPLASQISDALRRQIEEGTLHPATPLPSSRRLSTDLGVSRAVVVEAYEQLSAEGYLVSRRGSGTVVAGDVHPQEQSVLMATETVSPTATWDLRPGGVNPQAFPRYAWLRAMTTVVNAGGAAELGYCAPSGSPVTRRTLAAYLGRARGVRTRADRLMITSGFAQGMALAIRVLRDHGHTQIALEDPGHPGEWDFVERSGLRPVAIGVDADGIRVADLAASGARAVLVTPASQFPTGVPLSPARRAQLIVWAHRTGGYIIEDDFNGALQEPATQEPALQCLAPDRVLYAGSLSKVLAPALRLGWLAIPDDLVEPLERLRSTWDLGCSGLEQAAFAQLIESGEFDRHLRRLRTDLRLRRELLAAYVQHRLPGSVLTGGDGSPAAYLRLPAAMDEQALVEAAGRRSVLVHGGRHYRRGTGDAAPALVLGYATGDHDTLVRALDGIAAPYREQLAALNATVPRTRTPHPPPEKEILVRKGPPGGPN